VFPQYKLASNRSYCVSYFTTTSVSTWPRAPGRSLIAAAGSLSLGGRGQVSFEAAVVHFTCRTEVERCHSLEDNHYSVRKAA